MSDDWLQHGHEMDGVELMPVLSSSGAIDARADMASTPRLTSGWRGLAVGGAIAVLATLGVVGVANAIGDNLFPSMGSARPSSVWLNPVPPTAPEQTVDLAPPATSTTTVTTATTAETTVPDASSVTVPSPGAPVTSPAAAATARDDDDEVVVTTGPVPADDSDSGSGSGSDDSGSGSSGSGSSGSGSSGSDDSDDVDDSDDD